MKYISVSIGLLFVLLSCSKSDTAVTVKPTGSKQLEAREYQKSLSVLPPVVESNEDFVGCMSQSVNMCVSSTVMTLAQETKNTKLCDELQDITIRNACRQTIVTLQAREKKDIKLCDTLGSEKDNCKSEIMVMLAVEAKDIKQCDKILGLASATVVKKENPLDSHHSEVTHGNCIMQVISQLDNPTLTLCDTLKENMQKEMCMRAVDDTNRIQNSLKLMTRRQAQSK